MWSVCQAKKKKLKLKKMHIVLEIYVQFTSKMAGFRVYLTDKIRLQDRKFGREGDLAGRHKPLLQPRVTL